MAEAIVVHPLGISVLRSYLLSRSEITAIVGTRVSTAMPDAGVSPRFPALRLGGLTSVEIIPRRLVRLLFQVDCWDVTQPAADHLGELVRAVLRESANYQAPGAPGAVMGETQDLVVRPNEPDTSVTPDQPRSFVTGHALIHPNP